MGASFRTKNPGAARRQGRGVLEQTDSPLALFFVVAISRARQDPKSIHVYFRLTPASPAGNSFNDSLGVGARFWGIVGSNAPRRDRSLFRLMPQRAAGEPRRHYRRRSHRRTAGRRSREIGHGGGRQRHRLLRRGQRQGRPFRHRHDPPRVHISCSATAPVISILRM
jgi:hypothetical protein